MYIKYLPHGNKLQGHLVQTQAEVCYKPMKYKWINVLALLDKNGKWLHSDYWKLNQRKKAHEELYKWGWICTEK